jgi:hypothetical protein
MVVKRKSDIKMDHTCILCAYHTNLKSNFRKHLLSSKHQVAEQLAKAVHDAEITVAAAEQEASRMRLIAEEAKNAAEEAKNAAEHAKHAIEEANSKPVMLVEVIEMFMKFQSEQMKQSSEQMKLSSEQMKQSSQERFQNTEIFKSLTDRILACQQQQQPIVVQPQNIVVENSNNNNKQFNLNFYLNEECKNAMNLSDFIQNVAVSMEDLEHLGEVGYTEGMQRILTKALHEKETTKRPIHCSDVKREVIYVRKDEVWTKDESKEEMEKFIRYICHKNLKKMKEWCDQHPEHQVSDSPEYEYWYNITRNMCNTNPNATKKLISHLAQVTAIDKGV